MALFLFSRAILALEPIDVYNRGDMERDFTYIGDIVEGLSRILKNHPNLTLNGLEKPLIRPLHPHTLQALQYRLKCTCAIDELHS